MEKTPDMKLRGNEATRIEAAITKYHTALVPLFKEMKRDQAEIEKLRTETRAMLAELKAA